MSTSYNFASTYSQISHYIFPWCSDTCFPSIPPFLLIHCISYPPFSPTNINHNIRSDSITLGGIKFSTIDSVKQKIIEITSKITDDSAEITDPQTKQFLLDLFSKHQNSSTKLTNSANVKISYGKNKTFKANVTKCFYIVHPNGTKEDISYLKCIAGLQDEQTNLRHNTLRLSYDKYGPRIVNFILRVINEFVLSQPQIMQVLTERFPYKKLKLEQQYLYFRLIVELSQKCQGLEEQLFTLCIDRFLQIDADIEISNLIPTKVEQTKGIITNDQNQMEEKMRRNLTRIHPEPEIKVGFLLEVIISSIDSSIKNATKQNEPFLLEEYVDLLLKIFEEKIIPAHKTNYVQYIYLYLFSIPELQIFREKFLSLLLLQSFNEKLAISLRLRFLNYLASFLATSRNHNLNEILIPTLKMILEKINVTDLKFRTHIIQTLLYTLCYKWGTVENTSIIKEIFNKILENSVGQLPYIDQTILLEISLLLQKIDNTKYANEISVFDNALLEQKNKHLHPVNAYFLFAGTMFNPVIIDKKLKDATTQFTYRQTLGIREKNNSFNTTNSGSVDSTGHNTHQNGEIKKISEKRRDVKKIKTQKAKEN